MRAGIIQERSGSFTNVFQGQPDAAHEMGRAGAEVDEIGMDMLLRADSEIQGLKSKRAAAVQIA